MGPQDRGEAVVVLPNAPTLLRLPERPWGPMAVLPSSVVSSIAGEARRLKLAYHHVCAEASTPTRIPIAAHVLPGNLPPRVGVVRDAFAPHDQEPRPLASSVAPLGQGSAAVASALSQSDSRQVSLWTQLL